MLKKDHPFNKIVIKLAALILMNLMLCAVFFVLSSIPDHGIYMSSWHLELFLVWYPLSAVIFGAAAILSAFGDRVYLALMGVIFLTVTMINALTMNVVELPAAFVYTGIMLCAALVTAFIKAAVKAYMHYRNYKLKKGNKDQ